MVKTTHATQQFMRVYESSKSQEGRPQVYALTKDKDHQGRNAWYFSIAVPTKPTTVHYMGKLFHTAWWLTLWVFTSEHKIETKAKFYNKHYVIGERHLLHQ